MDIKVDSLYAPGTLVSLNQIIRACHNVVSLCRDPSLPYLIGSKIHVSTYGMYGYAMLCGTDFRKTMNFAVTYHQLATPLVEISFHEKDGYGIWTISPVLHPEMDGQLYRFVTELQFGINISLHRDVMGSSFVPKRIAVTYDPSDDFRMSSELVGCPVSFGESANQLVFDADWLDVKPPFGSRANYVAVQTLCDELISEMTQRAGVTGRIRELLLRDIANHPTFEETARLLCATTRTLRRQLASQNTSFRELLDELRAHVAMKFLRDTKMSNEDIALALGFSDGANFRRAFQRWSGQAPSGFRRTTVTPK